VPIRVLLDADADAMRAFLAPRAATSMFLLSNSLAAGLVDHGQLLQATYASAFDAGELVGVAAHCWNGMLLVQGRPSSPRPAWCTSSRARPSRAAAAAATAQS
jgi:hypothetical protein